MQKARFSVFLFLVMCLVCCCAHMSQFERAKKTSLTTYETLKWAKGVILDMKLSPSPEIRSAAEKAVPIYNRAQELLSRYNRRLLEWELTGEKPSDLEIITRDLQVVLLELRRVLAEEKGVRNVTK